MPVSFRLQYAPLLYSKTGVYRGVFFFIFAPKHRWSTLFRTASVYPQFIYGLSIFSSENFRYFSLKNTYGCHGNGDSGVHYCSTKKSRKLMRNICFEIVAMFLSIFSSENYCMINLNLKKTQTRQMSSRTSFKMIEMKI